MEFSRPEYWSGWPFPSSGDLPNPGIKPRSPELQADSLPAEPQRKPKNIGVGSLSLLQGIFLTEELNWGLLHCRQILYQLSDERSPESEKAGLKFNIQNTKIMASSSTTSWQTDGEKVEIGTDFIFFGSKITVDGDCSPEIKRHLFLGRKAMTNLDSILQSRDITANKGLSSQSYGFSSSQVWMLKLDHKED